MKRKINKLLGKEFKKEYKVKLLSILEEDNILSMLITRNNEEMMFRIDKNNDLEQSIKAIIEIIKGNVELATK